MSTENEMVYEEECPVVERPEERMTFTRIIGMRTPTGSFGGWGPRLSTPTRDVIKPN
jgi:hypothetical protein